MSAPEPFEPSAHADPRSDRRAGNVPGALLFAIGVGNPLLVLALALAERVGVGDATLNFHLLGYALPDPMLVAISGAVGAFVTWGALRVWAREPAGDRVYYAILAAACPLLMPACLLGVPVAAWAWWQHAKVELPSENLAKGVVLAGLGILLLGAVLFAG
jgi:hypothetical protein